MKVRIDPGEERFPYTFVTFGDELDDWDRKHSVEVPDDVAKRWKDARDAWAAAQQEAEQFIGYHDD